MDNKNLLLVLNTPALFNRVVNNKHNYTGITNFVPNTSIQEIHAVMICEAFITNNWKDIISVNIEKQYMEHNCLIIFLGELFRRAIKMWHIEHDVLQLELDNVQYVNLQIKRCQLCPILLQFVLNFGVMHLNCTLASLWPMHMKRITWT